MQRDAPAGRRWGVMSAGLAVLVAGWAGDVGVTYGFHHQNPAVSFVPVFGPLIQLGDKYQLADPNSVKTGNASIDQQSAQMIDRGNRAYASLIYTGLVIDAALQLAGTITAIVGASSHTRRPASLTSLGGHAALSLNF